MKYSNKDLRKLIKDRIKEVETHNLELKNFCRHPDTSCFCEDKTHFRYKKCESCPLDKTEENALKWVFDKMIEGE